MGGGAVVLFASDLSPFSTRLCFDVTFQHMCVLFHGHLTKGLGGCSSLFLGPASLICRGPALLGLESGWEDSPRPAVKEERLTHTQLHPTETM